MASALEKPVSYFFPPFFTEGTEDDFDADERELVRFYRQIWDEKLRAIVLQQVRSIAEADISSHQEQTLREAEGRTDSE